MEQYSKIYRNVERFKEEIDFTIDSEILCIEEEQGDVSKRDAL